MEKTTNPATQNMENIAGNINLSALKKKKFTIDNDPNRVVELNISDFTIINRFNEAYPKLQKLADNCYKLFTNGVNEEDDSQTTINTISNNIDTADKEMRELIDYVFDAKVSDACLPVGCMYDLMEGEFVFEHIFSALFSLFESNISKEVKKAESRMKTHTDKYTKR